MQKTDKLDELLRLLALEHAKEADDDTAAAAIASILSQSSIVAMSSHSIEKMTTGLAKVTANLSFGRLLQAEMEYAQETPATLAINTKLPEVVIEQLLNDGTYTNNVPIIMLKDLLKTLNISFDTAEQAIRNTFLRLKARANEELSSAFTGVAVPAYRKENFLTKGTLTGNSQSNGKGLFENEQVMEKYLKRLKELIAE